MLHGPQRPILGSKQAKNTLHQRGAQLRMSPTDGRWGDFAMQLDELGHREVNVRVQALLQLVLPAI